MATSIIDKALQAILKMLQKKDERVLLWENASPTSLFSAQSIDIDGTGYDWCRITAYTSGDLITVDVPMNTNGVLRDFTHDTGTQTEGLYLWTRHFRATTTKVTFEKAWLRLTNSASYSTDGSQNMLIPQEIYGIKSSGGGKLASLFRKLLVKGGVQNGK